MKIFASTALFLVIALPAMAQVGPARSKTNAPETRTYGKVCTVTRGSILSLRSGPGKNYGVLTTMRDGNFLPLITSKNGQDGFKWWLTKTSNHRGWVRADYVCDGYVDTASIRAAALKVG